MAAVELWFVSGVTADPPLSAAWHRPLPSSVGYICLCWCVVVAARRWPHHESMCDRIWGLCQQALGWAWAVPELRTPGLWRLGLQSPQFPKGLVQMCKGEKEQAVMFLRIAIDLALCIWLGLLEGVERDTVAVIFIFLTKQLFIPPS